MRSKSPELRMALKLQHCLERRQAVPDHPLDECIKVTVSYAQLLEQQFQRLHYARRRGWTSAIGQVREQLIQQFRLLEHSMTNTATQINRVSTLPGPTLRDLYEEICHLRREFSEVELDLKAGVVAASRPAAEGTWSSSVCGMARPVTVTPLVMSTSVVWPGER